MKAREGGAEKVAPLNLKGEVLMKRVGEVAKARWLGLDCEANCRRCGDVGEPMIDVFFYDVVGNGDSPFMGS